MKLSLMFWTLCCNDNTEMQGKIALAFLEKLVVKQTLAKISLLGKTIFKYKLAFIDYCVEVKILFYGAKRRRTVWKVSVGMLYKFGKR